MRKISVCHSISFRFNTLNLESISDHLLAIAEPVDLQLGSYRYMNPKKPHPDDLETYFSLQDCIEPSRYPSWVPREETLEEEYDEVQNYSFSITILMHASAFNDFLSYEPKTLESARYGVNLPPFCSTGFSPLIRINTNPKPLGLTYETYQYSSSHHSLESPHKNHNKRHPSPPNKVSSNKRAKLSESSSPAESLTISIPKSVVDFLGIATILHELNGQNLPIAIIFGYIITLTGGILFISYPPTLEELVLYAEVRRLHEQFKTPCGELDNTLIHIFRSLYELPEFGALDTDIIMKLLRALSADELHLWTLRLVAPLINSPELLHSAFDALLPLASTKFLVYLSYASISPRAQYYTLIDPHRPTFEDCTELLCEGENGLELLDLSEDALDLLDQNFVNNLCAQ